MENRRPPLHFTLDDHGKKFIWKLLCQSKDIEYFELKKSRKDVKYRAIKDEEDENIDKVSNENWIRIS